MMRHLIMVLLLAGVAGCSAPSDPDGGATGTSNSTVSPPAPGGTRYSEPRRSPLPTPKPKAGKAAGSLANTTRCETGTPYVELTWKPATDTGTQRVVYTPYADGYRNGRYAVTEDLPPTAGTVTLTRLSPGSAYTWLVLTRHGERWDASRTAQFLTPVCGADEISPGY
ncbi:MAG: hypothetical protein ACRDTM_04575 [Micromonosporaceae bacterium]